MASGHRTELANALSVRGSERIHASRKRFGGAWWTAWLEVTKESFQPDARFNRHDPNTAMASSARFDPNVVRSVANDLSMLTYRFRTAFLGTNDRARDIGQSY